jgi:hypothetical protein
MRTDYKGHTIDTAAERHATVGWTASANVYARAGTLACESLDLGPNVTFATEAFAHRGALQLGRAWVDALAPSR